MVRQIWVVTLALVGCGDEDPHRHLDAHIDSPAIDAPSCEAANCDPNATCTPTATLGTCACNAGYDGDGHTCTAVAVSLSGLRWEIPCSAAPSGTVCNCVDPTSVQATLAGASGTTYDVMLRFRGVVEQKTYTGGTADSYWYTGGDDNGDGYNVYKLQISDPVQTYYVNAGSSGITRCWPIDFTKTLSINAGATITLSATAKDNQEITNQDGTGANPFVIAGIPPDPNPYNGQFVQMDVVSVTH